MSDDRPIGIFDSGLGGLTVVKEVLRLMPSERVAYLGDTSRCPYGGRSNEAIMNFGMQDAKFLMSMDIKMLIVSCNTVSSVALDYIREVINEIPVIGVVLPCCKAAVHRTAKKKIGVIGTAATIRTGMYEKIIRSIDPDIKVFSKACPLFVPIVEEGLAETDITRAAAQYYLFELLDTGIDGLILGCTHYPLLMEVIQATMGNNVNVMDSALWTAREAYDILFALNGLAEKGRDGFSKSVFYITDFTPNFMNSAGRFLGREIPDIRKVELEELCRHEHGAIQQQTVI